MLPQNTNLGKLEIFEIYEYLDGPRLFAARNNIGTMFLVYWWDEEVDATGWLYLPISEEKLNKLRRKEITLNTAFREPETDYSLVYTGIPPREDSANSVSINDIESEFFPPEGYYIEYVDVVNDIDEWSFETILRGRKATVERYSELMSPLHEIIEGIMKVLTGEDLKLNPKRVLAGSIEVEFDSESNNAAIKSLNIFHQLIESNTEEEFRKYVADYDIDTRELKDFLSSLVRNELSLEITPKLASDGDAIKMSSEHIKQSLEYLKNVKNIIVPSIKVPQANDIDKMIEILRLMNNGIPLIHENIEGLTTRRQVDYYLAAAKSYGLANQDNQLTTTGHLIISQTNKVDQYKILADRFDSTDFGWAWIEWAEADNMTELDPETAADFLIASVPELSEVTARRRASTLRKWLVELQPYHRKYNKPE